MSAKHEIEAFLAELTHAWDKFDIERMVGAYAEDGHMISPFGTDNRGHSQIAESMRGMAPVFEGSKNHLHGLELRHINDNLEFFDLTHGVQSASGKVRRTPGIHGCRADVRRTEYGLSPQRPDPEGWWPLAILGNAGHSLYPPACAAAGCVKATELFRASAPLTIGMRNKVELYFLEFQPYEQTAESITMHDR
jgi:uncharacterized protein (TIGR02246 family)